MKTRTDRKKTNLLALAAPSIVMAATSFASPATSLAQEPTDQRAIVINVRAYIDGLSSLCLQGDSVWWHHKKWVAPGRLGCAQGEPIKPTDLNGVEWFPEWPDYPDCRNEYCNCLSSTYTGMDPPIPEETMILTLERVSCRHDCYVVQHPTPANGFLTIVEFDDGPPSGADWYEINLVLERCEPPGNYCESLPNSSGHAAEIGLEGTSSVSANDAVLTVSGCPPGSFGLFLFGKGEVQYPFGNGFLCISPLNGLARCDPPLLVTEDGDASQMLDLLSFPPPVPGDCWNFQFWFRDTAAGGAEFNLSDGMRLTLCP